MNQSDLPDWDDWITTRDVSLARESTRKANRLRLAALMRRRKNIIHGMLVTCIAVSLYLDAHAGMADWLFVALAALVEVGA